MIDWVKKIPEFGSQDARDLFDKIRKGENPQGTLNDCINDASCRHGDIYKYCNLLFRQGPFVSMCAAFTSDYPPCEACCTQMYPDETPGTNTTSWLQCTGKCELYHGGGDT